MHYIKNTAYITIRSNFGRSDLCPKQRKIRSATPLGLLTSKRIERSWSCAGADHCGQIASAEQWILRSTDTRRIDAGLLVAERSPLGTDIDNPIAHDQPTLGADHIARSVVLNERRIRMCIATHLVQVMIPTKEKHGGSSVRTTVYNRAEYLQTCRAAVNFAGD